MIDYQEIGNNIKICRIRCNLKQAELAEMVGVIRELRLHIIVSAKKSRRLQGGT